MFIGHHAAGFAAKRLAPQVSLGTLYVANVTSPPPPDARAIGWAGMAAWLFVPWGAWIDRHRQPRT